MQNRAKSTKNHGKSYGKSTKNQGLTFLKLAKSAMKFSILGLFMQQKAHAERIILNHEAQLQEFFPPQPQNPALQQFSEHALFQESHEFLQQDQIWQDSNNLGENADHINSHDGLSSQLSGDLSSHGEHSSQSEGDESNPNEQSSNLNDDRTLNHDNFMDAKQQHASTQPELQQNSASISLDENADHINSHGEQFGGALHNPDANLNNHRRQITSIDTQYDGEISVTSQHAFQTTQLTDPTEYLAEPFADKLPDGTFIVAWRTYRDDKYRILLQQFDENHNKVDEEIEVTSYEDSTLMLRYLQALNNDEILTYSYIGSDRTYSKINLKTRTVHSSTPLYCSSINIFHLQDGSHVILCYDGSNSSSRFAYLHKLNSNLQTIIQTKVSPSGCNSSCYFYNNKIVELIDGGIAFAYSQSDQAFIEKYSASLSLIKSLPIQNRDYINYFSQLQNHNILLSCSNANSLYINIYNSNLSLIAEYNLGTTASYTPKGSHYQLKDSSILISHRINTNSYSIRRYSSTNLTPLSTALANLGSSPVMHQLLSEEIVLTYYMDSTYHAHKFDSSFESLIKVELFPKDRIYPSKMQELSDGRLVFAFHTYATRAYLQFRDADLALIDSVSLGTGEIKHMHLMSNNNPLIVYGISSLSASSYLGQTTSTLKYQRYATFYDLEPLALTAITSSSREIGSIKYMLELLQNGVQPDGEDGEAKYDGEYGADSATKSDGEFDKNIVYDKNAPKIAQHEFLPAEMRYYPGVTILNGVLKVEMSPFSANALLRQVEINMNMYTQSFILRHVLIDPTQKNNIVEGITKVTYGCFDKSADLLRCEQPVIVDDGEAKYDGEDGEDGEARHDGEDGEDGEAKSDIKTKPDGEDKKGRGAAQDSKTQPEVEGFSSEATAAIAIGTAVGGAAIATIIASKVVKKAAAKAIQKVASDKNAKQAKTDKENEDQKDLELNNGQRDAQMEGQGENARDGNNLDENNNRLDTQNMHSQVELRQDFSTNNLSSMNIDEAGNIKEKTASDKIAKDNAAKSHEMQSNAAQSGGKKTTINLRPQQNLASELRDGLRDQLQDEMMEKMHRENALPAIIGATVFLAGKQLSKEKVHEELQGSIVRIINGRMDKLFYAVAPKLKALLKEERAAVKHHDGEQSSRKDGDLQVIGASEGDSSFSSSGDDDDLMQTLQNAKLQTGQTQTPAENNMGAEKINKIDAEKKPLKILDDYSQTKLQTGQTDPHGTEGAKNSMGAILTRKKQAERVRARKNPQNSFKNDFNSPQDITVTEPDNFSFSVNFEQSFEQGHNASSLEGCDHSSDGGNPNSKVDSQQHFNSTGCKTQPKTSNTSLSPTHAMQKQQSSQSQYFDSQHSKNPSSKSQINTQTAPQAINMQNLTETFIKNALALLHHKEVPGAAQIHTLDPDHMHEQLENIRKNVKFIDHCNGNKCYEITQIQGVQAASLLMNYMMHNLALNENSPATEKAKNNTPQVEETLYNALLREKNNNQMEYAAK